MRAADTVVRKRRSAKMHLVLQHQRDVMRLLNRHFLWQHDFQLHLQQLL